MPDPPLENLAEGGGIEPHWFITSPRFSGPLADHSAAPSDLSKNLVAEEGFEPALFCF